MSERSGQPIVETLSDALRERELLVVLDNFEHLPSAAPAVATLLRAAPRLTVLATSRAPLHLHDEYTFPVPPLATPDPHQLSDLATLVQVAAVALFVRRAQAVRPSFELTASNAPAVAALCALLDGLPLALELAAARTRLFSPEALLARLGTRLELLAGGGVDTPPRQQTIRATLDWSYGLLAPAEQQLFARLGVFAGGWTLHAAVAVCGVTGAEQGMVLEGLTGLLDQSLIQLSAGAPDETRFTMLETMRAYAREQLAAQGEQTPVQRRHAEYYCARAETLEPQLYGAEQTCWLARCEQDLDNYRAALRWCLTEAGEHDLGARISTALYRFWRMRGYDTEARTWMQRVLSAGSGISVARRARALRCAGNFAQAQGDYPAALEHQRACLVLYRELGDGEGICSTLYNLGSILLAQGDLRAAEPYIVESEAMSRALNDAYGVVLTVRDLGWIASEHGEYDRAEQLLNESLTVATQLGDPGATVASRVHLAVLAYKQRNYERATRVLEENLALGQSQSYKGANAAIQAWLGRVRLEQGDAERAQALFKESLAQVFALGDMHGIAFTLEGLADVAAVQRNAQRAARLLARADTWRAVTSTQRPPTERAWYERLMVELRAQLDEAGFAAAWADGQAMTLDQVVAYALE